MKNRKLTGTAVFYSILMIIATIYGIVWGVKGNMIVFIFCVVFVGIFSILTDKETRIK